MSRAASALVAIAVLACGGGETPTGEHPLFPEAPIIVVSIDTVRADHLVPFGGSGAHTPVLDALARESVVFSNAWSHAPLTLPSHVSMLTGTMPYEHGVRSNLGYGFDAGVHPSVPGLLRAKGWPTGAAVSAYVLRGSSGIGAPFDFYDDAIGSRAGVALGALQRDGFRTAAIAADWIEARAGRPFFFLLHLFEPHSPYEPPERFAAGAASPYDGEIAAADAAVGEFLDRLREAGVYDRAVIVVLSDHGEGLGDHGEDEHGIFLYREALHVPLMVRLPGGARGGERSDAPVGLADLAPTLLGIAGVDLPPMPHARSLFSPSDPERTIYAETMYPRIHLGWSELRSLTGERLHYIEAPESELYDYRADPGERRNRIEEERRAAAALRNELAAIPAELAIPAAVDPEEAARLQALGYLGAVSSRAEDDSLPDPKAGIGQIRAMSLAFAAAATGDRPRAIGMLRRIVEENPELTDAWSRLGMLLEQEGNLEAAERAYKTALSRQPRLVPELALALSKLYLERGDPDQARTHAELALRLNPAPAHQNLAHVALMRGDLRGAEEHARRTRSHPSHRLIGSVLLAEVMQRQGRLEEAFALVEQARREAEAADALPLDSLEFVRGDLLARLERFDEAADAFRADIAAFPKSPRSYLGLATVHRVRGDLAGARETIAAMVRANPGPDSRRRAAVALLRLDDPEGAAAWE
ncbi:MAG TPA: sulfatase-like hydrolase/transferase [Thermoanaerobaculia bacterium]|nr:sulfatase-like hydrolase/transferase [Thermoanaerobaculia bacterium]